MSLHQQYNCPICKKNLKHIPRYPNYICHNCAASATDITGRKLIFSNKSISGGFIAVYADNSADYDSHICYVNGIMCFADEARFGGIVIQKINADDK